MTILEITKDNIEQYKASLEQLILAHMHVLGTETSTRKIKHTIDIVLEDDSHAHFIASVDEDAVNGFCFFNTGIGLETGGRYVWFNEIHIKKSSRHQGIGRAMLAYLIEWAKRNDYSAIYGITHRKNIAAQDFFDATGFIRSDVIWVDRQLNEE